MLHFLILYSPFKSANSSKILFIDVKIHLKLYREHSAVQIAGHIDGTPVQDVYKRQHLRHEASILQLPPPVFWFP